MIAAIDPGHQRAEFAIRGLPAADHDLMAGTAFRLDPMVGAAGLVGCLEPLRDNAFQRHFARGFPHRLAAGLEMFKIMNDAAAMLAFRTEQFLQAALALPERLPAKIELIDEQQ